LARCQPDSCRRADCVSLRRALGGVSGGYVSDRFGRDRIIVASLLRHSVRAVRGPRQHGLDFVVAAAASGFFLNGSFVVMTVRGQNSAAASAWSPLMPLSIGLGGVAAAPLALLANVSGCRRQWRWRPSSAVVARSRR
jgi:MFS family permease